MGKSTVAQHVVSFFRVNKKRLFMLSKPMATRTLYIYMFPELYVIYASSSSIPVKESLITSNIALSFVDPICFLDHHNCPQMRPPFSIQRQQALTENYMPKAIGDISHYNPASEYKAPAHP